ncbi:MAG: hypothetical protein AB3N16_07915 [Flavobacteriaceae bacterium]
MKIVINKDNVKKQSIVLQFGKHKRPFLRVSRNTIYISTIAVRELGLEKEDTVEFVLNYTDEQRVWLRKTKAKNGFRSVEHPTHGRKYHRVISNPMCRLLRYFFNQGDNAPFLIGLRSGETKNHMLLINDPLVELNSATK